ncbi:MAG: hypothetical protein CVU61_03125 [Deltaproteobacteria bacterium HGW-Deltaproteobacteria-19]|jgi:hypothetical protein|nr:MAG: hypothetical protein CVU61_03125 [Deltaproteobacteria bacterium HGW-Deltaproteobacteria-19]
MKAKTWWILVVFLMALFIAGPVLAAPVGKVTHLEGKADLTAPGGKAQVLKLGDPINNGDILRTKSKAKVGIIFTDGNTLWLAEKTRMKISRYNTAEKSHNYFDLFRGKSRTVVTKLSRGSRMEVHTPTAVCGVRGTIIIGLFMNGESAFFLQGGAGYGYSKSEPGKEVAIPAGSGMVVTNEKAEPVVKPSTATDIEQHMQDTSAGTGEGSGSTDSAEGTTLDVAIPWTPSTGTETPPPVLIDESTDITFSTSVLQDGFAGTLEGSYGLLTRIGTVSYSGTGPSGPAVTSLATPLTGILSNGATYTGLIGGVTGTYHGFFNSITNNGGALGILAGKLDGTYSGGNIAATGTLNYDTTSYVAASAFQGFSGIAVPTFATTKLSGLFSYEAPVETGLAYGYLTSSGGLFGLWGFSGNGGEYVNDGGYTTWISYYGYDFTKSSVGGPSDVFMLGLVTGTDDMAGHTTLTGNDSIQYMDRDYFGLMSVSYMGEYLGANYEIAGTGIYKLAPLAFTGDWGGDGSHPGPSAIGAFMYDNTGSQAIAGTGQNMYGLVGGFSLPWSGGTTMYAMGSYTLSPNSLSHYLWLSDLTGKARSGGVTDAYRKFDGYMTGLWLPTSGTNNGTIEGSARTLFQNVGYGGYYNGTIGILSSDSLSGDYYGLYSPGAGTLQGMWQASGTLAPSYSETITDATLATGSGTIQSNTRLAGKFNNGGSIYAEALGSLKFYLVDTIYRPWGIYKMALQSNAGTYSRPAGATTWSARLGGEGIFGDGATAAGYWVATINGTWNDTGEIRGQLGFVSGIADSFSMWMTRDYVGILSGQVYGVSDSSTSWVGESVGSYTGTKLAFMAEENGSGKFWDYDSGTSSFVSSGGIPGLIGGTESLFNGAGGVTPYPSVQLYGVGGLTKTGGLDYTTILGQFSGGIPDQAGYRLSFAGIRTATDTVSSFLGGVYWNKINEGSYSIGFLYSSSDGARSSFTTHLYEDLPSGGYQMWFLGADSRLQAYQIATVASAPGIDDWVSEGRNNYTVSAQGLTDGTITQKAYRNDFVKITNEAWSVGVRLAGGTYDIGSFTEFNGQSFTMTSSNALGTVNTYDRVDFTSVDDTGVFAATVAGAQVGLEAGWTSVNGAVAKGLFDPDTSTWRMAGAGFSMETGAFLDKINGLDEAGRTAFQKATGIPTVVVGTADLAMTNNASNPNITALNMNNVTFLASQSGSAPQIWATQNISGSYSNTPLTGVGKSVTLGGGGLTADFTPVAWTGTYWGATVSGSGLLSGGSYTGTITFKGGAAGTHTVGAGAGTLSGTGAGTAQASGPF